MKTCHSEEKKKKPEAKRYPGVLIWPRRAEVWHRDWLREFFPNPDDFEMSHWEGPNGVVGLICGFSARFEDPGADRVGLYRMVMVDGIALAARVEIRKRETEYRWRRGSADHLGQDVFKNYWDSLHQDVPPNLTREFIREQMRRYGF